MQYEVSRPAMILSHGSDTYQDTDPQMPRPLLSAAARNTRFSVREALKAVKLHVSREHRRR